MHFTDDQLENDPELRPRTWKSEKAFEQERLFLLHRLATNLRAATKNPSSNPSTTTMASSSTTSLISTTSEAVAVDPDQTPCSNCSIFPCSLIPSMPSTPRSMSSFFSNSFGSISRTSIASSDSAFTPHTPLVFNSPQSSTFSFDPSPLKVDSVMGSPLKLLRSPSIFKRKDNKTEKKGSDGEGSATDVIKDEGLLDFFKHTAEDDQPTNTDHLDDGETVKDFVRTESDGSLDSQGKEYVVDRLGLGVVVAEPQPVEHQYRFVKRQIEKAKKKVLRCKFAMKGS